MSTFEVRVARRVDLTPRPKAVRPSGSARRKVRGRRSPVVVHCSLPAVTRHGVQRCQACGRQVS